MQPSQLGYATLLAIVVLLGGCRKEDGTTHNGSHVPWQPFIRLSVDSMCVQAPNVITPNGDGINDNFWVVGTMFHSITTVVKDMDGDVVFSSTDQTSGWTDLDSSDVGRYRVSVQVVSGSGVTLSAQSYLDIMDYGTNSCLEYAGEPVTGDRLDPRRCDMLYPTNEIFCP
jgi:hypothetical protein